MITGDKDLELLGRYEENAYMHRMMMVNGNNNSELYGLRGLWSWCGLSFNTNFDKESK